MHVCIYHVFACIVHKTSCKSTYSCYLQGEELVAEEEGERIYSFAKAAMKKYYRLGSLKKEIYFLTVLEAKSPRSRCQWV